MNYDENGVPDEQHILVARIQGRNGVISTRSSPSTSCLKAASTSSSSPGRSRGWKSISWAVDCPPVNLQRTKSSCQRGRKSPSAGSLSSRDRSRSQPNRGPHNRSGMETPGSSFEILDLRHFAAPVFRPVLEAEGELWALAFIGTIRPRRGCSCSISTTTCCPATQRFHPAESWAMYSAFMRRQRLSSAMYSRCPNRQREQHRSSINHRRNTSSASVRVAAEFAARRPH